MVPGPGPVRHVGCRVGKSGVLPQCTQQKASSILRDAEQDHPKGAAQVGHLQVRAHKGPTDSGCPTVGHWMPFLGTCGKLRSTTL